MPKVEEMSSAAEFKRKREEETGRLKPDSIGGSLMRGLRDDLRRRPMIEAHSRKESEFGKRPSKSLLGSKKKTRVLIVVVAGKSKGKRAPKARQDAGLESCIA